MRVRMLVPVLEKVVARSLSDLWDESLRMAAVEQGAS